MRVQEPAGPVGRGDDRPCGLKGTQVGGAKISEKHANFIIAEGECTSQDVLNLIETVQRRVQQEFGIELELELEIW